MSDGTPTEKCYWLIEAPGPAYLRASARHFDWVDDAGLALHLATEAQGDALMMSVRELCPNLFPAAFIRAPRVVEHMFVAMRTPVQP
jgi:hypothetical protein